MDISSIWTGRLFAIFTKGRVTSRNIQKNNSFQHNFGTVIGEKLTGTILKSEMSVENKENKIVGMWDQIHIWANLW